MPTVLFLCADNALASPAAEALFNGFPPRGWRATSAGLEPASAYDPRLTAFLEPRAQKPSAETPRPVAADLVSFMRTIVVVSLRPGQVLPPYVAPKVDMDLKLPDPAGWGAPGTDEPFHALEVALRPAIELCRSRTPRMLG